jgi:hypothetical protein
VPEVQTQRIPHRMKRLTLEIEAPEDLEPGEILQAISRLGGEGRITDTAPGPAAESGQMSFEWEPRGAPISSSGLH